MKSFLCILAVTNALTENWLPQLQALQSTNSSLLCRRDALVHRSHIHFVQEVHQNDASWWLQNKALLSTQ